MSARAGRLLGAGARPAGHGARTKARPQPDLGAGASSSAPLISAPEPPYASSALRNLGYGVWGNIKKFAARITGLLCHGVLSTLWSGTELRDVDANDADGAKFWKDCGIWKADYKDRV